VLWVSLQRLSETFVIQEEISEMWLEMYIGLHVKYPLFLSDFNKTWIFSTCFRETLKYQILFKSVQWANLFHEDRQADRRTDMTKLIATFRYFSKALKN
jgi:hypothetical protein